jgi:hypothetical protein
MSHVSTAGFPALAAFDAAIALHAGQVALVVIDGPEDELALAELTLRQTNKVRVDSYVDGGLERHLLVEVAR